MSIPNELVDEIDHLVDSGRYSSTTEFVKEAIRRRLEEVES